MNLCSCAGTPNPSASLTATWAVDSSGQYGTKGLVQADAEDLHTITDEQTMRSIIRGSPHDG